MDDGCVGVARAPGAATIVNAVAGWNGAAFAINLYTKAEVRLKEGDKITGDAGGLDPTLIEIAVEKTLDYYGLDLGGEVVTSSELPVSRGLKSSSAAANAVVLATCEAIGEDPEPETGIGLGVEAAIEADVTVTGAYDDASASYLGGITITDNKKRRLLKRQEKEHDVLIVFPSERHRSGSTDVEKTKLLESLVKKAHQMALNDEVEDALTLNGLLYCATLGYDEQIAVDALEAGAEAAGLSGTGTAFAALVKKQKIPSVKEAWDKYGKVIETQINNKGATKL
ncbi:MAG: Archaeal shikimate kinase [Candidatus Methanohalarchaeum thermophilum]|uniref:Shikimate kinase n=1 Tax=Methanohalarchaeum thermophilum TaxID=1903181 RepID=A0A1Q6DSM7_METT1|nr:MAG: Archaeal shikimate kinase [Candidatus Methanohalarchaeum thermophilum]